MVPQLVGLFRSRPRARSRARWLALSPCAGIELLEERTLLSASLALFNGNFAGTYKGTITVNNNGTVTKSTVSPTAFQATITNGVLSITSPVGTGSGTVDSHRNIVATVNTQYDGVNIPIALAGKITAVNSSGTAAAGAWSYSANLGNGVTASGSGTWTLAAPPVLSDFNGHYVGSYKGTVVDNNNGTITTSAVSTTADTAVINNGQITVTFGASTGLTSGPSTIDVHGNINGTATYVEDGVTITVNYSGSATRSLSGVNASGTWSYSANLGNGLTETGSGTWAAHSVLVFDGAYAGSYAGTVVENNNGTTTTSSIPGSGLSDNSLQLTIANGKLTMTDPGISGSGTGTVDENGNIAGTLTYVYEGVTITVNFTGSAVQTPFGNVITGTWSFSANLGNGVTLSGQGTWTAESPTVTV